MGCKNNIEKSPYYCGHIRIPQIWTKYGSATLLDTGLSLSLCPCHHPAAVRRSSSMLSSPPSSRLSSSSISKYPSCLSIYPSFWSLFLVFRKIIWLTNVQFLDHWIPTSLFLRELSVLSAVIYSLLVLSTNSLNLLAAMVFEVHG